MLRVLLDINVVLDVLAKREPHFELSAQVWAAAETGNIQALIAAHSVTTLYYLLSRHLGKRRANSAITDVLRILDVAPVNRQVLYDAFALGWSDFEDAVQATAAIAGNATHLVTRNVADFKGAPLPVLQPVELLALLRAQ